MVNRGSGMIIPLDTLQNTKNTLSYVRDIKYCVVAWYLPYLPQELGLNYTRFISLTFILIQSKHGRLKV